MPRTRLALAVAAAAASAALLLGGCASTPDAAPTTAPGGNGEDVVDERLSGELTIYAAASLKDAFDEIANDFETENPGVDIVPIVYDGSSTLVTQLSEGAVADVFASADEANMAKAVDAGVVAGSVLFATNTLVIAMPEGNPAGVTSLADLADPAVSTVVCAPEVPCGAATERLLAAAGVEITPVSFEQNVTAVLTKVAADIADAGFVYRTDVAQRDDVESIVPAEAVDVVNRYPIAVLEDATNPEAAEAFLDYVTGAAGQAVLAKYGFGAP